MQCLEVSGAVPTTKVAVRRKMVKPEVHVFFSSTVCTVARYSTKRDLSVPAALWLVTHCISPFKLCYCVVHACSIHAQLLCDLTGSLIHLFIPIICHFMSSSARFLPFPFSEQRL
jgi:hypothetical protein